MPITKGKIRYTLDLSEQIQKVKPSKRKEVTDLIGETILEEIQSHLDQSKSPVAKGQFKKTLSKQYAKRVGTNMADLQLTGDMLNNLTYTNYKDRVEFKITDGTEKKKAYNHNVGDTLPVRQFIPNDETDETFKRGIMRKVKDIINNAIESEE